ncbi:phage protease [Nocardia sp. NPDC051981]|uniref:phage protease n=1 Tax=Nocardia sp. NPDC051981 TaxID=3155417 RepID=UPI0034372913
MALTFTDEQQAKLFDLLGLPPETDPADIEGILAVVGDLASQAQGASGKPSDVAAAAKRHGLEAVDTATMTALRADAAEGRRLIAAAAKAKVEGAVDDAIRHGKITPARRKHWVDLITADNAMADVLASVPNETAVPMTELGHGQTIDGDGITDTPVWFS